MSELSAEARAVLDAGRRAHDPLPADRARVRAALRVRMEAPRPARVPAALVVAAVVVAALVAIWLATRTAPTPPPAPPPRHDAVGAAPAHVAPAPAALAPDASAVVPTVDASSPADAPRAAAPRRDVDDDTLPQELRLLATARSALAAGRWEEALRALSQHRQRFPRGQLAEERDATALRARCAGHDADVAAAVRAFLAAHPRSPHAARVRRECGL